MTPMKNLSFVDYNSKEGLDKDMYGCLICIMLKIDPWNVLLDYFIPRPPFKNLYDRFLKEGVK